MENIVMRKRKLLYLGAIVLLLSVVHQAGYVWADKILKESFENRILSLWVKEGNPEISSQKSHSGTHSLSISKEHEGKISRDLTPSEPGKNLTVDAWIYVEKKKGDANLAIRLVGLDKEGDWVAEVDYLFLGPRDRLGYRQNPRGGKFHRILQFEVPEDTWFHFQGRTIKEDIEQLWGVGAMSFSPPVKYRVILEGWSLGDDFSVFVDDINVRETPDFPVFSERSISTYEKTFKTKNEEYLLLYSRTKEKIARLRREFDPNKYERFRTVVMEDTDSIAITRQIKSYSFSKKNCSLRDLTIRGYRFPKPEIPNLILTDLQGVKYSQDNSQIGALIWDEDNFHVFLHGFFLLPARMRATVLTI